jgi:cystathionine gamma-lyase / homocysteine desulfhydrase
MTHAQVPRQRRLEAGITDGLMRMSVGIEEVADIINDLEAGLDRV